MPAPAISILAEEFLVPLDDYHLRVRLLKCPSAGSGPQPTLGLLHDSLGCITLWRDFPERLAAATSLDVLVYDRRGYGQSSPFSEVPRTIRYLEEEATVLLRLLAACGIAQSLLFGHSDGGTIALLAAALAPSLVAGVVTEGAHVFVEELTLSGIRAAQEQYTTTPLRSRLARYHGAKTDAIFAAWVETWLAPAFRAWNIEACLPRIQAPVLVLQGEADEYGTAAQVRAIAGQVAGPAQVHLLPSLGHTPHKDAPDEVLRLTTLFVEQVLKK